jgi:hypothetical protein
MMSGGSGCVMLSGASLDAAQNSAKMRRSWAAFSFRYCFAACPIVSSRPSTIFSVPGGQ